MIAFGAVRHRSVSQVTSDKYGRVRLRMVVNAANCNQHCNQYDPVAQRRRASVVSFVSAVAVVVGLTDFLDAA